MFFMGSTLRGLIFASFANFCHFEQFAKINPRENFEKTMKSRKLNSRRTKKPKVVLMVSMMDSSWWWKRRLKI